MWSSLEWESYQATQNWVEFPLPGQCFHSCVGSNLSYKSWNGNPAYLVACECALWEHIVWHMTKAAVGRFNCFTHTM